MFFLAKLLQCSSIQNLLICLVGLSIIGSPGWKVFLIQLSLYCCSNLIIRVLNMKYLEDEIFGELSGAI